MKGNWLAFLFLKQAILDSRAARVLKHSTYFTIFNMEARSPAVPALRRPKMNTKDICSPGLCSLVGLTQHTNDEQIKHNISHAAIGLKGERSKQRG